MRRCALEEISGVENWGLIACVRNSRINWTPRMISLEDPLTDRMRYFKRVVRAKGGPAYGFETQLGYKGESAPGMFGDAIRAASGFL